MMSANIIRKEEHMNFGLWAEHINNKKMWRRWWFNKVVLALQFNINGFLLSMRIKNNIMLIN